MYIWTIDWPLLAGLIGGAGAYLWAVGPARQRFGNGDPRAAAFPTGRASAFLAGLLTIGLAIMSPIGLLADRYLFTMHMTQHMLLAFIAAPLLLIGTPEWLLRPFVERWPALYTALRWATRPLVTLVVFNVVFTGWHVPRFYDAALHNDFLHIVEHQTMTGTALLLWAPTLMPLHELRTSYPLQIVYYFVNSIFPTVLGALLTFSAAVWYPTYLLAPRVWDLSALGDQRVGALLMWIPGSGFYMAGLTYAFFRWLNAENQEDQLASV